MHKSTFEALKPTEAQIAAIDEVRLAAKIFSDVLLKHLPEGRDKDFVIRSYRSTIMWANIAILRLPDGTPRDDYKVAPLPGVG